MPLPRAVRVVLVSSLSIGACDGSTVSPEAPVEVTVEGRAERGLAVLIGVRQRGEAVPPGAFDLSARPSGAVAFEGDGRARLLEAGAATIVATVGGRSGEVAIQVDAPPDIVFDWIRDGSRDIWRAPLDGRDPVRLVEHPAEDRNPTAAGGRVVFESFRDGNGELYSVSSSGGAATRLTTTAVFESDPALSGSGSLAFVRPVGGSARVFVAGANAADPVRVTADDDPATIEAAPAWSPSGAVVFVSTRGGTADLWVADPDPWTVEALLVGDDPEVEPAWSPDGRSVAFVSVRDGADGLFSVEVSTGAVARLVTGVVAQPAWLADGRLVFAELVGGMWTLRWIDPAEPAEVHAVGLGGGHARNPEPLR